MKSHIVVTKCEPPCGGWTAVIAEWCESRALRGYGGGAGPARVPAAEHLGAKRSIVGVIRLAGISHRILQAVFQLGGSWRYNTLRQRELIKDDRPPAAGSVRWNSAWDA